MHVRVLVEVRSGRERDDDVVVYEALETVQIARFVPSAPMAQLVGGGPSADQTQQYVGQVTLAGEVVARMLDEATTVVAEQIGQIADALRPITNPAPAEEG